MKQLTKYLFFLGILVLTTNRGVYANPVIGENEPVEKPADFILQPYGGLGVASSLTDASMKPVLLFGTRLLLPASGNKTYGIEVAWLDLYSIDKHGMDVRYLATGIILEQKLWQWFNMSIGTIGYIGLGENTENVFGITTNLGWEPDWKKIRPFITYRSDFIFDDLVIIISSVSLGVDFLF